MGVTDEKAAWGRVDDDGTVYVRDGGAERAVGQYPDATPEEALAYYVRKYTELAGQVSLLEQRVAHTAPAADVATALARLTAAVDQANAVGDLDSLRARLSKLGGTIGEITEKQSAEAAEAVAKALADREEIVAEAERLAALDPAKIQWKQVTAQLDTLFQRWQQHQQTGPRIPKGQGNDLWKRFRDARARLEAERKAFFSELDGAHREARARKQRLAERAEALAPQGAAAIPAYRTLLDEWKAAGRAGKKADDALWARFKAAGDVLYGAKARSDAQEDEEFRGNLEQKLELLTEAETLLTVKDRQAARTRLADVQRRWDAIGKVPRDQVRVIEERIRKVETHVRKLEDDHWTRSNPEKQARSEGLAAQLTAAITRLEAERDAARAAGDARTAAQAEEAIAAQQSWLAAIGS
ncbi:MAG: DUF349 domain-containing protein [Micrococcales bacterium]|nr:DUF349 domain-containing protein [Micrococcales bacterium]